MTRTDDGPGVGRIVKHIILIVIGASLLAMVVSIVGRYEDEREKECLRELIVIRERLPRVRVDFFDKLIPADNSVLRSSRYCRALELAREMEVDPPGSKEHE